MVTRPVRKTPGSRKRIRPWFYYPGAHTFSDWGEAMGRADSAKHREISRYLSRVLRHDPESIGLSLDAQGWARIDELVERAGTRGVTLTSELVLHVAKRSDKQRFTCDGAGRIRANHGHTVPVDLGIEPSEPPSVLFHGTAMRSVASIKAEGLIPGVRQYVHLSADAATASAVGRRHGRPVVLQVAAGRMWSAGFKFVRSASAVWLISAVPAEFIQFP
jgi:putative RNA 2'-phosphotransferase